MTSQDREQFQALLLRQRQLEEALSQLRVEFQELERRTELHQESIPPVADLPPLPIITKGLTPLSPPPLPVAPVVEEPVADEVQEEPLFIPAYLKPFAAETQPPVQEPPLFVPVSEVHAALEMEEKAAEFPPVFLSQPAAEKAPETETPVPDEEKQGGLEFQFGRWLARIGAVFAQITLISFSTLAYEKFHSLIGPWTKLTVLTLISSGLIAGGLRIERKNSKLTVYGRTMAGGGLACLYYTLYGATYVAPLQVIHSTLFGGLLLLAWSAYVLYLAEAKKSELLSIFAIALAYFSSAITPVGGFTMVANLLLSVTAVVFLVRNAWTGLSYLCLVGTYVGLLRQFVIYDGTSNTWFEVVHSISFWPAATYLAGAWVIYTAGIFLANTPSFASGKRMAFLCLNNGALIGLLTVASYLSEFGHIGAILCLVGGVFVATSYLARRLRTDANELAQSYLMQGLALATGGVVIAYSGVTRGLLIIVESVFLAAAGAYSRNPIMRYAACISSLLGTAFLLDEINPGAAHPWVLILGGAAAMLTNAWLARRDFWHEAREVAAQRIVLSSGYYILLALGLLGFGMHDQLNSTWASPVMAFTALVLTFSIYLVPLFELPILAQILLVFAEGLAVSPLDDSHLWWSEGLVGLVTMILVAWWPRQKIIRTDAWLQPLMIVNALGMVAITACAVHPHVDEQGWMISASLLSLGFLLYGIFARTWSFACAGQILLAASVSAFFTYRDDLFPWTWWAAAVPIASTFLTAWLVQEWLRKTDSLAQKDDLRGLLKFAVCVYQGLAVAMIVRLIFGLVPDAEVPLCFFGLGTALMAWNIKWPSSMGVRSAMALDLFGTLDYLAQVYANTGHGSTWFNAAGLVLLLAQPALLRHWGAALVSKLEIIGVTFLANLTTSLYVYYVIHPHVSAQGWMIAASLLSLAFLAYGAWTRLPQFMISGQVYLAMSVYTFLSPPTGLNSFPWTWWAAALPPAVVFLTGWLAHRWLPRFLQLSESARESLSACAYAYQIFALALVVRWVFGVVPAAEDTLAFFLIGTGIILWNLRWPDAYGLRCGFLLNIVGAGNYLFPLTYPEPHYFTWADTIAFTLFLAQPAMLRRWGRDLVTTWESWAVILVSSGMAWLFVSNSIEAIESHNLTLGWALFALALTVVGFASNERRQRWCGLAILLAAIIRGGLYDFWMLSDSYKVLTFFVLTVICLGLSFLYYKFADRLKEWL